MSRLLHSPRRTGKGARCTPTLKRQRPNMGCRNSRDLGIVTERDVEEVSVGKGLEESGRWLLHSLELKSANSKSNFELADRSRAYAPP